MIVLVSYVANAVAGLAYVSVGALLLFLRPARPGALAFATFALAAGAQHLLGNLAGIAAGTAWASALGMARYPFLLVAPLWIVYAAARYHGRVPLAWLAPFALQALAGGALMIASPSLLFDAQGFERETGHFLLSIPYIAAIAVAGALVVHRHSHEASPRLRIEALLLAAALLPYVAYTAGVAIPLLWSYDVYPASVTTGYLAVCAGALVVVAWTSAALWRTRARAARVLAAMDLAVAGVGFVQSTLIAEWAYFGGVLRLAAALVLGYALLKYRLFDIDLRVKTGLARTLVAGLVAAGFFVGGQVAEGFAESGTGSALAGFGVALVLLIVETRVTHLGRRLADRVLPRVEKSDAYIGDRKHAVYRAAVESAAADGITTPQESAVLRTLARELGLSAEERGRIEREVRVAA